MRTDGKRRALRVEGQPVDTIATTDACEAAQIAGFFALWFTVLWSLI